MYKTFHIRKDGNYIIWIIIKIQIDELKVIFEMKTASWVSEAEAVILLALTEETLK